MAIVFPLLTIFPAFFVFSLIAPGKKFEDSVLPAVLVGPVVSCLIGVGAMYARLTIESAVLAIYGVALVAGAIVAFRGGRYKTESPRIDWAFPTIFAFVVTTLVVAPVISTVRMRVLYDGWFHIATAVRIIDFGVPPEDPIYPVGVIHNYWFYHAWGALLASATSRSPADSLAFVNFHAIVAVVVAVWKLAGLLSDRPVFRRVALLAGVLGMNALGWLFFMLYRVFPPMSVFREYRPTHYLGFMTFFGDCRIPYFLDKFISPNGFPIGIQLFAAGLLATTAFVKDGNRADRAAVLFLSLLGIMLFHPTSGLGLYMCIGTGFLATFLFCGRLKHIPIFAAIIVGIAGAASLPYLLSVAPSKSDTMQIGLSRINVWYLLPMYTLSYPFIISGARRIIRKRSPALVFTAGATVGILAAACFIILPGQNEYKFIQLAAIPLGMVAAAAFIEFESIRWKNIVVGVLAASVLFSTGIWFAFRITHEWARVESYAYDGINVDYISDDGYTKRFCEWVRDNTPKNAILVSDYNVVATVLCSERSVISSIDSWTSKGHPDQGKRVDMVLRLFSPTPIRLSDIEYLNGLGRPVFIVYPDIYPDNRILDKFALDRINFEPARLGDGYIVFRLKQTGFRQ